MSCPFFGLGDSPSRTDEGTQPRQSNAVCRPQFSICSIRSITAQIQPAFQRVRGEARQRRESPCRGRIQLCEEIDPLMQVEWDFESGSLTMA